MLRRQRQRSVAAARAGLWIVVVLAGIGLGVFLWRASDNRTDPGNRLSPSFSSLRPDAPGANAAGAEPVSPFALADTERERPPAGPHTASNHGPAEPLSTGRGASVAIDPFTLGREPWSDEDFFTYAAILGANPVLFDALLESFRSETDPRRLSRLAMLLAEVGGEGLTEVASDMVYSGHPLSRSAGLELLGFLQPEHDAASAVAIDVLSADSDPAVLVDALNTLAVVGQTGREHRAAVLNQVQTLVDHPAAGVRRQSLSILGRWSKGVDIDALLQAGLADPEAEVRRAATYALAGRPGLSAALREVLFSLAENTDEARAVRTGAVFALQQTRLGPSESDRLKATLKALSRQSVSH